VNGAAIEASASDSDNPTSAVFNAPQSLAPSPHMPTSVLQNTYNFSTSLALSSGDILAYICALSNTCFKTAS
jgi:hypothetical protein